MRNLILFAIAAGVVSGCGGGQAASSTTTAAVEEEQTAPTPVAQEPAQAAEEEPEEEPAPTGPGRLRVINRVGGEDSTGTVRVLDANGEVVAEGTSGETFTLEAGSYRLVGEITDAEVLIDTPTREADGMVTVVPGQEQTASIDHPVSRVRLRVVRRGRPVARWRMEVRPQRGGGEPLELRPSNEHIPITPGRYDATLHIGSTQIEVTGIIFQGGATMDVPVSVD